MTEENIKTIYSQDEVERKVWDVIKQIPGLNVGYGSVRLVIYIGKGNREESWESAAGVAKGLVETAAITGSVFIAPIVTPIAAGALTGVVSGSIKGIAHLIVFVIDNPDDFVKKDGSDRKEQLIYNEVKEIPAIGAAYSAARTPIYLIKGNKQEAKISGINFISEGANTAVNCGVGMLSNLDDETQKIIQKISKTLIQVVSKKMLEKVANKQLTLEEGLSVVESVEAKCDALTSANMINEEDDPESSSSTVIELTTDSNVFTTMSPVTQNPETLMGLANADIPPLNLNIKNPGIPLADINSGTDSAMLINNFPADGKSGHHLKGLRSVLHTFINVFKCKYPCKAKCKQETTGKDNTGNTKDKECFSENAGFETEFKSEMGKDEGIIIVI